MFLENRVCFVRLHAVSLSLYLLKVLDINTVRYIDEVLCRKPSTRTPFELRAYGVRIFSYAVS